MSGGSMEYTYLRIEEFANLLQDPELIQMAIDFAEVWHDCEWMYSGDVGEGTYNKTVMKFKRKWFDNHDVRQAQIIEQKFQEAKNELLKMIGYGKFCIDCRLFNKQNNSDYGNCPYHEHCLVHGYDDACEKMEEI